MLSAVEIDWPMWEPLIEERGVEIDRPRGTDHPRYPGWTYPLDYGYIPGTIAADGHEVMFFCGLLRRPCCSSHPSGLTATATKSSSCSGT
jgi:hypothetical protein